MGLLAVVLFVSDFFHPLGAFAVFDAGNGNMGHGRSGRRAVPVFDARRTLEHISGPEFFDCAVSSACPANAKGHHKVLACGMRMPKGTRTGLKRDIGSGDAGVPAMVKKDVLHLVIGAHKFFLPK